MLRKNMGWILSAALVSSHAQGQYFGAGAGIQASMYAGAQGQWGSGYYGAMQPCMVRPGAGAISQSDEMVEIKERQKEIREELSEKKRELRSQSTKIRKSEYALRSYMKDDAVADVRVHVTSGRQCHEWTGRDGVNAKGPGMEGDNGKKEDAPKRADSVSGKKSTTVDNREEPERLMSFTFAQWKRACSEETGNKQLNNYEVCRAYDGVLVTTPKLLAKEDEESCIKNMGEYQKSILTRDRLTKEIARLEAEQASLKEQLRAATKEFKKDLKDGVYDDYDPSDTEGIVCHECERVRKAEEKNRLAGIVGNVGMGLLGIYLGSRQTRMIADYNASIGQPTQNNYFPYMMAAGNFAGALYGAMGGGTGYGAYGCGSTIAGGGNMYGPYGIAGPYMGANVNPFLMNGMMAANGMLAMNGFMAMNGMPMAGMPMMGMPMGGGAMMAMNGMPMAGMPMMGMPMGGGAMMAMNGMPMMGMPMMGMPMGGGAMMAMNGMPMAGMPMMGMPMGGGAMMAMNGMPMMGMPMGGAMMAYNSMGQLQMQMQMMQQQMQYAQMQAQQQQMYLQNEMRRQQTLGSLNMELQSLMMRIQQVQYGGSFGGSYGGSIGIAGSVGIGGSIGGGGVYYNGNGSYLYPQPYPNGNTNCIGVTCAPATQPVGSAVTGPGR